MENAKGLRMKVFQVMLLVLIIEARLSLCSPAYEFAVPKPEFGETPLDLNVTSFTGHTSRLPCTVRHLAGKQVSWIRGRDLTVLSSGRITFATDVRITVLPGTHSGGGTGSSKRLRKRRYAPHVKEQNWLSSSISSHERKDYLGDSLAVNNKYNPFRNDKGLMKTFLPDPMQHGSTKLPQSNVDLNRDKSKKLVERKSSVRRSSRSSINHGKESFHGDDIVWQGNKATERQMKVKRSTKSSNVYHNGRYKKINDYSYTSYGYQTYGPLSNQNSYHSNRNYYDEHVHTDQTRYYQRNVPNYSNTGTNLQDIMNPDKYYSQFTSNDWENLDQSTKNLGYNSSLLHKQFDASSFNRLIQNSNAKLNMRKNYRNKSPRIHVSSLNNKETMQMHRQPEQSNQMSNNFNPSLVSSLSVSSPSLASASSVLPSNYLEGVWEPEDFTLQIKYTEPGDAGTYICQVNTEPKTAQKIHLTVIDMIAKIMGPKELFVKAGTPVTLVCQVDSSAALPGFIFWYKGDRLVDYEASEGRIEVLTRSKGQSDLILKEAVQMDSSNYTCGPAGGQSASVILNVIVDERPAAMQQGNKGSNFETDTNFILLLLTVLLTLQLYVTKLKNDSLLIKGYKSKPIKEKISNDFPSANSKIISVPLSRQGLTSLNLSDSRARLHHFLSEMVFHYWSFPVKGANDRIDYDEITSIDEYYCLLKLIQEISKFQNFEKLCDFSFKIYDQQRKFTKRKDIKYSILSVFRYQALSDDKISKIFLSCNLEDLFAREVT